MAGRVVAGVAIAQVDDMAIEDNRRGSSDDSAKASPNAPSTVSQRKSHSTRKKYRSCEYCRRQKV